MTDLTYFRGLLDEAKDPLLIAFYEAHVRSRNGGALGPCQHTLAVPHMERSYGSTFYWNRCVDCGARFGQRSIHT